MTAQKSLIDDMHRQRQDLDGRLGGALSDWVQANTPAVYPHVAVIALLNRATQMASTGSAAYQKSAAEAFRSALANDSTAFQRATKAMHDAMVADGMRHKGKYTGPLRGPPGTE